MMWTDETVAQLRQDIASGMTYELAGKRAGVSKNAAIGKANREGFKRGPDAILTEMQINHAGGPQPVVRLRRLPMTLPTRLDALDLFPKRGCVFPLGHPGKTGFGFCGAETGQGFAYCPTHDALTHVKGSAD